MRCITLLVQATISSHLQPLHQANTLLTTLFAGLTLQRTVTNTTIYQNLTNELKHLLKVLPEVLLAVVGGRQPFVAQSRVDVVEGQVCRHVDHVADVEAQQQVQVLGVSLVPQKQEGQDGTDDGVLRIGSHHTLIGQGSRQ